MMIPFLFTRCSNDNGRCFVEIGIFKKKYDYYEKSICNAFIFMHA